MHWHVPRDLHSKRRFELRKRPRINTFQGRHFISCQSQWIPIRSLGQTYLTFATPIPYHLEMGLYSNTVHYMGSIEFEFTLFQFEVRVGVRILYKLCINIWRIYATKTSFFDWFCCSTWFSHFFSILLKLFLLQRLYPRCCLYRF